MDTYLIWLIAGIALIIAELLTGTFFLLVLGIAAIAGGGAAFVTGQFWIQVLTAGIVAVAGMIWVKRHRKASNAASMAPLDLGQPVRFESWVNRSGGHARVRYRDTSWEAFIRSGAGDAVEASPGDIFYIVAVDGNTLSVSADRQARA